MTEQIKRGRGRLPKAKTVAPNKPKVVASADPLHTLINSKFKETHGFELTQAQAHAFLMNLVSEL